MAITGIQLASRKRNVGLTLLRVTPLLCWLLVLAGCRPAMNNAEQERPPSITEKCNQLPQAPGGAMVRENVMTPDNAVRAFQEIWQRQLLPETV